MNKTSILLLSAFFCSILITVFLPENLLIGATEADSLGLVWTLWHVAWSLVTKHSLGIHTDMILFPNGGTLFPADPVEAIVLTPITINFGPVFSFNFLQVVHFVLVGVTVFLLSEKILKNTWSSVLASLGSMFSPALLAITSNGNIDAGQLYLAPLACLAFFKKSWLAGLVLGLAFISNIYVGIIALVLLLALAWVKKQYKPLIWTMIVAAIISGPVLVYSGFLLSNIGSVVEKGRDSVISMRLLEGQGSLLGLLGFESNLGVGPDGRISAYASDHSLSYILLILAALRLRNPDRTDKAIFGVFVIGIILALGPVLKIGSDPVLIGNRFMPLPFVFFDQIPPFSMLIELWRFSFLCHIALALLAGRTILNFRFKVQLLLIVCFVVEMFLFGPNLTTSRIPNEPIAKITQGITEPILSFPVRQGDWPLFYQTIHHQPVANSPMNAGDPAVFGLISKGQWNLDELATVALNARYRWLLLHTREELNDEQPVLEIAKDLHDFGLVFKEEENLILVDLHNNSDWPQKKYKSLGFADF